MNSKRQKGEKFPQEEVDFHFLETEAMNETPEDYDFFLLRELMTYSCLNESAFLVGLTLSRSQFSPELGLRSSVHTRMLQSLQSQLD